MQDFGCGGSANCLCGPFVEGPLPEGEIFIKNATLAFSLKLQSIWGNMLQECHPNSRSSFLSYDNFWIFDNFRKYIMPFHRKILLDRGELLRNLGSIPLAITFRKKHRGFYKIL